MTQVEKYIDEHPHQFKDELDRWLFRELNIKGGACCSIKSVEYLVARGVGEKLSKALIDKAVKFLYEHREEVQTEDNGISGWIPDELIMDFKQAMETF